MLALQAPEVLDRQLMDRTMPIWHSGAIVTCTLTVDQAQDMHRMASLAPQQLAITWQVTLHSPYHAVRVLCGISLFELLITLWKVVKQIITL